MRIKAVVGGIMLAVLPLGAPAMAYDLRLDGGVGYGMGDNSGNLGGNFAATVSGVNGSVTGSASGGGLGGSGLAGEVSLWDDVSPTGLMLGLQYLHFQNGASFSFNGSGSGSTNITTTVTGTGVVQGVTVVGSATVTVPVTISGTASGTGALNVFMNAAMINAGWRWLDGPVHPYAGGGIGAAFADIHGKINANATISGTALPIVGTETISRSGFAGQVFVGTDFDLPSNLYFGVQANLLFTGSDFTIAGLAGKTDLNSQQLAVLMHLGMHL